VTTSILVGSLQLVGSIEIRESFLDTGAHGLFTFTDPDAGTVPVQLARPLLVREMSALLKVFLVWLVFTLRVSDLRGDKVLLVEDVIANTGQIGVSREQFLVPLCERAGGGVCGERLTGGQCLS